MALALVCAASAQAARSCANLDELCSGDPCVTDAMEVDSPCVASFGDRKLVIGGQIRVPDDGVLTLSAREIELHGTIDGDHPHGARVTLAATGGDIVQSARISVAGAQTSGTITLFASGNITIGSLIASAAGTNATAGRVTVVAAGVVTLGAAGRIGASGGLSTPAGHVSIRGNGGLDLAGHLDVGGAAGGWIEMQSVLGSILMGTDIRGSAPAGPGGTTLISAAQEVKIERAITMDGGTDGGAITVSGGSVTIANRLSARGRRGMGGIVRVTGDVVEVSGKLRAAGKQVGGRVTVTGGVVTLRGSVDARGSTTGGALLMRATAGDLGLGRRFNARPGGAIQGEAPAGNLTAWGRFAGGCIGLSAGGSVDTMLANLDGPASTTCGLVP